MRAAGSGAVTETRRPLTRLPSVPDRQRRAERRVTSLPARVSAPLSRHSRFGRTCRPFSPVSYKVPPNHYVAIFFTLSSLSAQATNTKGERPSEGGLVVWKTTLHANGVEVNRPLRSSIEWQVRRALDGLERRVGHVHVRLYGDLEGTRPPHLLHSRRRGTERRPRPGRHVDRHRGSRGSHGVPHRRGSRPRGREGTMARDRRLGYLRLRLLTGRAGMLPAWPTAQKGDLARLPGIRLELIVGHIFSIGSNMVRGL